VPRQTCEILYEKKKTKIKKGKNTKGMAQVLEHLPSNQKSLSSIPTTIKKKK
jgi:hypothetical protein